MHFNLQHTVALARFAATAFYVEAEAAGLVATCARLWQLGEPVADRRKQISVRRWVRARRPADRRLVDIDDLVELFQALNPVVRRRDLGRTHKPSRCCLVERIDDK